MSGRVVIGLAALAVVAYAVGLVAAGPYFPDPGAKGVVREHVLLFVGATLLVSLFYVMACVVAHKRPPRLRVVIFVAVAARLVLLFGSPQAILEGDRPRTRFDGRMVNQGLNPYEFTPAHLADAHEDDALLDDAQLERLQRARAKMTASGDAPRPEDVRRPDLRTHATPLALWTASLGDWFKPKSSSGYAFLILCGDVLAGFLLLLALRAVGLPLGWLIAYAWCPILLKEAYCTQSVDALMMPALAGLVYCFASGRNVAGAIPMALCIALRPFMIVLLPVASRKLGWLGVLLAVILATLPAVAMHDHNVPVQRYFEGQVHVWRHYEYNSALENVFRGLLKHLPYRAENSLTIAGVDVVRPDSRLDVLLAKVACMVVLLGVVTYTVIRVRPDTDLPATDRYAMLSDVFVVLVALLLVSPVLQPNHALWLLPLLVLRPTGMSWFALPGILALSHLTHLVGPRAADLTFFNDKVSFRVVEFGLFLGLYLMDLIWRDRLFLSRRELALRCVVAAPQPEPEPEYDPEYGALLEDEVALLD